MDKPSATDSKAVDDKDLELPDIEFVAKAPLVSITLKPAVRPPLGCCTVQAWRCEQRRTLKAEGIDAVRQSTWRCLQQPRAAMYYSPDLEPLAI